MKIVQKANKQLRIADEQLDNMLKMGFVEIDQKTGNPIVTEKPDETKALKKEIASLKKENAELKAEIDELKAVASENGDAPKQ